jgi:chromate reductase, NAD(P)H dehydrogenase (quinone)
MKMSKRKVGVFVGSLRQNSYSRQVANTLQTLAPESLELEFIELGGLEMYNQDFDDRGNPPASWVRFRTAVKKLDAVLFVTPEYNRSIPAVIKNALDIGSRPYGQSVWNGKPGAVISVSPGALGAFGANHLLRQSLMFLNIPAMQQPEAYVGNVADLYDKEGNLVHEKTREFFKKFIDAFATWIDTNLNT